MSGMWPKDIQCAVSIGFDVDGPAGWSESDPNYLTRPLFATMGSYGPATGLPRIMALLEQYDIKASFYIPGHPAETWPHRVEEIVKGGHEVAHHGYFHLTPYRLTPEEEEEELTRGIEALERITGTRPRGYRSPSWDLSPRSGALLARYGFVYDSSLMDDDAPYCWDTGEGRLVELPVHWLLDDFPYFGYASIINYRSPLPSPQRVLTTWTAEFDGLYKEGRCFILTLHPQIIGHPSRLAALEKIIQHILSKPRVVFMRAIDIADCWLAERQPRGHPLEKSATAP